MILYPAIDLKDGKCVRLLRGDMEQATIFNNNPALQAKIFSNQGFSWIHVVDLNGAFSGRAVNESSVQAILDTVDIPIQLGGGVRNIQAIEDWLKRGVSRVVLGTAAVRNPALVQEACMIFPGSIAVGIDARDGNVAIEGWSNQINLAVIDLARKFEDYGVSAIIYTDIDRDGALEGLNIDSTVALAESVNIPIIASGGVSSLKDLRALKKVSSVGIEGVIAGRSIYDGRLDPFEALRLLAT